MVDNSANNKRIAKNTLLLYVRMLFLMFISLYTSRVVLNALGIEDYGIYNVVGGFVMLFGIISGSLSTSISRFLTFELGKSNNSSKLNVVFSSALSIQILLTLIILFIGEVIGIWFINNKLVVPLERFDAARWVFQFSVITFCVQLLSVPYNAAIIAHEKMQAFAYICIVEALGKLFVAFSISHFSYDRLVIFGGLIAFIQCIISFIYGFYCHRHFNESRFHFVIEKKLLKQMFSFAGWSFIGTSASYLRDQGINVLINLFFGPSVNAARGLSMKVNVVVQQFVSNFMMALNPQIIKNYAGGDYAYMFKLMFIGSRASFYLLLLISLPIIINTKIILHLWLGIVPEYTEVFVKLLMLLAMSDALSGPIITAQSATGNIRNYQIVVGGTLLLNMPIVYLLFFTGFSVEASVIVAIIISQLCLFLRLYMFKKNVFMFQIRAFLLKVYVNAWIVAFFAAFLPFLLSRLIEETVVSLIYISLLCLISTTVSVLFIGCNKTERSLVLKYTQRYLCFYKITKKK